MMLPVNQIISFKSDTAERKRFFRAASFSHPAKMVLGLQIYLIEHYTKPGDTILDPMAGSGTILIGCTLGRNIVLLELEDKFVKMQQDNWEKIKSLGPMLGYQMGQAVILQGDARNLNGLLADNILFSPPYARGEAQISADKFADPKQFAKISSRRFREGKKRGHFASKEAILRSMKHRQKGCGENPDNISNLSYGEISAVISSPPYEGSDVSETHMTSDKRGEPTNPNYRPSWKDKIKDGYCETKRGYSGPRADAVITSPPYEGSLEGTSRHKFDKIHKEKKLVTFTDLDPSIKRLRKHGRTNDKAGGAYGQSLAHPYSGADENIGNLKSENYLQAMLEVYQQCHQVLKEGGLMVLVVKNFIRDKKVVRLDLDTIKICEKSGFALKERLQRKLTQQSFWRIIYHKKFPDVPEIEYEDVLIFQRGQMALFGDKK